MKVAMLALLLFSLKVTVIYAQGMIPVKRSNCYSGVIVPSEVPFPFFLTEGRFSPDKTNVTEVERVISRSFPLFNKTEGDCVLKGYKDLRNYKRQYFGYIAKGKKILFISFIKAENNNWAKGVVVAEGGGCSYIQVKYDLTTKKLYDLHINDIE